MATRTNIKFVDLKHEPNKERALKFQIMKLGLRKSSFKQTSINEMISLGKKGKRITKIVLSSLSLNNDDIKDIVGIEHYESRALWEILQAAEKNIDVIYVSSIPINKSAIKHLISRKNYSPEILDRIQFVYLDDNDKSKSLTEKLLSNKLRLKEFKNLIPRDSYISSFISSELEWELANKLKVPLLGPSIDLKYFQGKSGNRQIFKNSNIPHADGENDIFTVDQLIKSCDELWKRNPDTKKLVVKLDFGVSGNGNALLRINEDYSSFYKKENKERYGLWHKKLLEMEFQTKSISWEQFEQRISDGTIVEIFLEGENKTSPSAQGFIHPDGRVEILSTHEQILSDNGFTFLGCIFPANQFRRKVLQEYTKNVGKQMQEKGIIGPFAVDYLVTENERGSQIWAIEINVRQGGTTHPYQTAKSLTSSNYNDEKGVLETNSGQQIYYRSNDNVLLEGLRNKDVDSFLDYMENKNILFCKQKNKGVVFHMLGAMKDYGKIGYTAISGSKADANKLDGLVRNYINEFSQI